MIYPPEKTPSPDKVVDRKLKGETIKENKEQKTIFKGLKDNGIKVEQNKEHPEMVNLIKDKSSTTMPKKALKSYKNFQNEINNQKQQEKEQQLQPNQEFEPLAPDRQQSLILGLLETIAKALEQASGREQRRLNRERQF